MSEQELLDIFDARANMEAMLVSLAIARGGDEWEADVLAKRICSSKLEACDASEKMLDEWDLRHQAFHTAIVAGCGSYYLLQMRERLFGSGSALSIYLAAANSAFGGNAGR